MDKTFEVLESLNPVEHFGVIKRELETIPNVSDVIVSEPKITRFIFMDIQESDDLSQFFPYFTGASIKFKINLPQRIQNIHTLRDSNSGSETFDVDLIWDDETPVCYISYETEDTNVSPSTAIVAVRKFLENYFKNNSKLLSFETLGPSPFHADFYIVGKQEEIATDPIMFIEDESYAGHRYGDFRCFYKTSIIPNDGAALECFILRYGESISTFYQTVVYRNRLLHGSYNSKQLLQEMLNVQNKQGLRGAFERLNKTPRIGRDLSISLLREEIYRIELQGHIKASQRSQAVLPNTPFDDFVIKEADNVLENPTSSVKDLLKIFEERYLKSLENLTVLGAGLIGGILGSLITYLIGK